MYGHKSKTGIEWANTPDEAANSWMRRKYTHTAMFRLVTVFRLYRKCFGDDLTIFSLLISSDGIHWKKDGQMQVKLQK